MRSARLMLLFLLVSFYSNAQNFGGNPPGKWGQINTDTVRVIFPLGLDSIANRVATLAHHLQRDTSFKYRYKKINIVLQNNATISNAYVSLAPYRSELYLMPPQNAFELGSLNWTDNLVVHEWRHVQQYNYFNRGLSRVAGAILGQEGRALFNALSVPDWFFEGDAVWNETKYTSQGRGRLASFYNTFKAIDAESAYRRNFMQLRNGSLKYINPSHYELGYLLVSYGAEEYGPDFWSKVTADASSFRPLFYPLQGAIKKYTGKSYKQFVKDALVYHSMQWRQEERESEKMFPFTKITETVTDYRYPYAFGDSSFIAVRRSTKSNPAFYIVHSDGIEERIAAKSISIDDYFSYNNGKIVYSGYSTDARWTNRDYSDIRLLDLATKKETRVTRKGKFFSPDISHSSDKIIAVEIQTTGDGSLVLMDLDGKILGSWHRSGIVYSHPKFSQDDHFIYAIARNSKGEMSLQKIDVTAAGSKEQVIIPFANHILGFPTIKGDTVTLIGSYGQTHIGGRGYIPFDTISYSFDAAWVIDQRSGKTWRCDPAQNLPGFSQAVFSNSGQLIVSALSVYGYQLYKLPSYNRKEVKGFQSTELKDIYVTKALANSIDIGKIPTQRFAFKPYSKFSHPFNFHSWRPYYDPPEYSFTVYGQNVLNTVASEIAYTYNENENNHRLSGNLIYGGTYIQPFVGLSQTWNRMFAFRPDTVAHWNEFEWQAGLQLPLRINGGKMYRFLNLSASFHSNDITFTGSNKNLFRATDIKYIQSRISFSSQVQKASLHIYPRFAMSGFLQYRTSTNVHARQFLASGSLYLPGFFRTHNIVVSLAYQGRDTMRQYGFTNSFPFSRGYDGGVDFPRMWKIGGNYHLPLVHPDLGFANIVYFLRIRANAFTDYTEVQSLRTGIVYPFHTVGGELYFDTKWWNQLPVTFGVRYSRLMNGDLIGLGPNQWELVLPVDLIR